MNQHHWQAICFSVAVCGWNILFSLTFHVTLGNSSLQSERKDCSYKDLGLGHFHMAPITNIVFKYKVSSDAFETLSWKGEFEQVRHKIS